ncbi:hypothetical protein M3Y99_00996200 [Aphelenchoides fujianensis]|nr:hypothetical protein M3Y99_00996200 [Aphelenchoides fujianensis]
MQMQRVLNVTTKGSKQWDEEGSFPPPVEYDVAFNVVVGLGLYFGLMGALYFSGLIDKLAECAHTRCFRGWW